MVKSCSNNLQLSKKNKQKQTNKKKKKKKKNLVTGGQTEGHSFLKFCKK